MEYEDAPRRMPPLHEIPHYHGDALRALFVVAAILLVVGTFMSGMPALPGLVTAGIAIVLVVAAGITNPAQAWIHWLDALIAALGTLFFGSAVIGSYRAGALATDPTSFIFALALALIFLIALYFSTRTIRGMMLRELR